MPIPRSLCCILALLLCLNLTSRRAHGGIVINEVMANNVSAVPHGSGYPDWLELYNNGTTPVALAGLSLTDNLKDTTKFIFPLGTPPLGPGQYLVVYCDSATDTPGIHTGFSFSNVGEEVGLFSGTTQLDGFKFGLQPPDYSIGRIPNGAAAQTLVLTQPTPGAPNIAQPLGLQTSLRINEWMARPSSGSDWLELYNADPLPVSLGGLVFTDRVSGALTNRPIRSLSYIAPESFLQFFASDLAKSDPDQLDFKLGSGGETITLYLPSPQTQLDRVVFGAQQVDISQGRLPDGSATVATLTTPSPGTSNFQLITNVVVNEILTHTDPPLEDAVELQNVSAQTVDISNWWMSNSKGEPKRYRFPAGSILKPGGFLVVYEYQFKDTNPTYPNFTFNSAHGDSCFLFSADAAGNLLGGRYEVKFGSAEHGVSFGRYVTSTGEEFVATSSLTFGADNALTLDQFRQGKGKTNAYPKVGPLVITEIMYHPVDVGTNDNTLDEYVELYNITGAPLPLFNNLTAISSPGNPTNTYSLANAVTFDFPLSTTLPAGAVVLVVGFDPVVEKAQADAFRAKFGVPAGTVLFGPWKGKLGNSGASLELLKPDTIQEPPHPDVGYLPKVLVERVSYKDSAPWPIDPDGQGRALHRRVVENFGNDVANWASGAPSPGRLDPPVIKSFTLPGNNRMVVSFEAMAGRSYGIQSSPAVAGSPWDWWPTTVPASPTTRVVSVTNSLPASPKQLFLRVATPAP